MKFRHSYIPIALSVIASSPGISAPAPACPSAAITIAAGACAFSPPATSRRHVIRLSDESDERPSPGGGGHVNPDRPPQPSPQSPTIGETLPLPKFPTDIPLSDDNDDPSATMDSPSIQPPLVERPEVFPGEPPPPGDYPTDHVITIGPNLDEEGMDLPNLQPHRFTAEQKACLYRAVQNNKQQVQKALDEFSDTCYANLPKKKADWDKMCARLVFLSACAGGACALVTGGVTTPVMARLAGSSTLLITLCTQLSPDSD